MTALEGKRHINVYKECFTALQEAPAMHDLTNKTLQKCLQDRMPPRGGASRSRCMGYSSPEKAQICGDARTQPASIW